MDKIKNLFTELNNKRKSRTNEGFSLLELVVAVGILLILTVSGLVSYNGIVNNARNAKVNNLASDLFMMGASHRMAGKGGEMDSQTLEQWANDNNMNFEKAQIGECEIFTNTVQGEALEVQFTLDDKNRIKVSVENTSNNYKVERQEPNFNDCE